MDHSDTQHVFRAVAAAATTVVLWWWGVVSEFRDWVAFCAASPSVHKRLLGAQLTR